MLNTQATLTGKLIIITALAAACLAGIPAAAAVGEGAVQAASQPHPAVNNRKCPSQTDLDAALGKASTWMSESRFDDAAAMLQPLSTLDCNARVSLLLAAAFEGAGDAVKATAVLQRAHSVWPSNNSIAASLAREYLAAKEVDKAAKALAHFHATPEMPEQEMEMAALVYLAAHQLVPAHTVAEEAYKAYPSVHTLLLLANTLQLQGRYPDVNRLLASKRAAYGDSPEFLVTFAESEFDASLYPAAREDLQHAISLDGNLYQAHYLLGNVLGKMNDLDGAIAEYRKAIDLAPDQARTYYQLALALRSKQGESGEQQVLEQAIAADNHYAPAQCELGRILLEEHRAEDAVSHLTAAIQYNPRSEEAYFLLAKAYAVLGKKDKSDEMVKRLQAVRKENRPNSDGNSQTQLPPKLSTSP